MDQNTENQVKQLLASLLAEGVSLSDAQTMINSELKVALTYMDIRIIASTLDVDWKKSDPHPVKSEEDAPAEENTDTAAGNPDEKRRRLKEALRAKAPSLRIHPPLRHPTSENVPIFGGLHRRSLQVSDL